MALERLDIIRLCFGKTLLIGNKPPIVSLQKFQEATAVKHNQDIEAFGLFESSSPNYTTYYPDATPEDLVPKDGDFINPIFRALSEVIVHKNFNPIDFSKNNVLKPSMKLLKGQSINADHETMIGNAMGAVCEVAWQEEYKTTDAGIVIPSGINAELKIDGKSNPRIARGIMMDPPSINSVSVTVEFAWEKSHPKMPDNEFFPVLGKFDEKGNMYKRDVIKIRRYHEISLVSHGADPFAMLVNDKGEIVNPKYAHISYNSAEEKKLGAQYFFFDMGTDIVQNSLTIPEQTIINEPIQTVLMKESILLLTAMATAMGLTISLKETDTAIPAEVVLSMTEAVNKLNGSATELTVEKKKVVDLTKEVADLKAAAVVPADTVALTAFQAKRLDEMKLSVENKYKLLNVTPVQAVVDSIKNSNYDALVVMNATYETQLEEKMPLTCTSCKSTKVTRASAKANDPNLSKQEDHVTLSNEDTVSKLAKTNLAASRLHGVKAEAAK